MQGIFNQTHGDITDWTSELIKYQNERKFIQWGQTEKPKLITYKQAKEREDEFNPILQTYRNKEQENLVKNMTKKDIKDILSKNKDNTLRIEQTYDLITLENKLQRLEPKKPAFIHTYRDSNVDFTKYTKMPRAKSNIISSKLNHNIVSNISLDKHSSIEPGLRPEIKDKPSPRRIQKINVNYYKDYDIISNNYKEYTQEKTKIDKEISKIETNKKYNKLNNFNLITAEFYDIEKEKDFQNKREIRTKNLQSNPNTKSKYFTSGYLYNPINMSVINESGLKEADNKAKNKKKRYELRNLIDIHRHTTEADKFQKSQDTVMNKISYNRFKAFDDRGFSILNQDEMIDKDYKRLNPNCKDIKSDWEKIIKYAGSNNNLKEKSIYKEQYDCDNLQLNKTSKQFILNRKNQLEKLPLLNEDSGFNKTNAFIKIKTEKEDIKNKKSPRGNFNLTMNKGKWFEDKKNNFYYEGDAVEKVNYYQERFIATADSNIKSRPTLFVKNKLKEKDIDIV